MIDALAVGLVLAAVVLIGAGAILAVADLLKEEGAMKGLRCVVCGRVIRTEQEPLYYVPSGEPVGLHERCEDAYENGPRGLAEEE